MENQDLAEDEIEENVEIQQDAVRQYYEDVEESPSEPDKESIYSLFKWVISKKDSSKVSNLDRVELGMLDMSVRDMQNIAILCDVVEYDAVGKWLRDRAEVILATSSSKKGWLAELFVSAKKFLSKEKRLGIPEGIPTQEQKSGGFWSRLKRR